jgi:predicted molibdopterin-dependent oxidoreductase YjgC
MVAVSTALKTAGAADPNSVAGLGSTRTSNEENFLFQKLFRYGLGTNNIDHRMHKFPIVPMETSIADIGKAKSIVAIGFDPKEYLPVTWLWIYKAISKRGAKYVQVNSASDPAVADAIAAGDGTIILTDDKITEAELSDLTKKAAETGAKVNVLLPDNNSWGAINMGVLPYWLPSRQSVSNGARPSYEALWGAQIPAEPGLDTDDILDAAIAGKVKALLIMGSDPVKSHPNPDKVREALSKIPFLAIMDMFMTETAKYASAFIPVTSFAEKEGSFTNIEGRVQHFSKAIEPRGQSRPDWQVLSELLAMVGKPVAVFAPADVLEEIETLASGYSPAVGA